VLTVLIPAVLTVLAAAGAFAALVWNAAWWVGVVIVGAVALLAWYDVVQRRHSILRNYPVLGHLRL
jgi:uncharacterized membrane protein YkvI